MLFRVFFFSFSMLFNVPPSCWKMTGDLPGRYLPGHLVLIRMDWDEDVHHRGDTWTMMMVVVYYCNVSWLSMVIDDDDEDDDEDDDDGLLLRLLLSV